MNEGVLGNLWDEDCSAWRLSMHPYMSGENVDQTELWGYDPDYTEDRYILIRFLGVQ